MLRFNYAVRRRFAYKAAAYEDLEIDSPYNTYTRDGLPPTPICNPGAARPARRRTAQSYRIAVLRLFAKLKRHIFALITTDTCEMSLWPGANGSSAKPRNS
jgi:hypothetical protein